MTTPKPARSVLRPVCVLALSSVAAPAIAQQQPTLEQIVVTAQKREQSLQDVPVSVSALPGAKMQAAAINKFEDLQLYVPNLQMTETGISTQMYIRGIGSGNNQAFEQSVGQYVDGIYYGRQQLMRAPMMDLERVEVLRGPQGTLFGKNSIAGAINMSTRRPTDVFEGAVSLHAEPEHSITHGQLVLSGPFSDEFAGRIVMRIYEEDGYLDNSLKLTDEPGREEFGVRGTLMWTPSENVDATLKIEQAEFDVTGRQVEIIQDDPSLTGAPIPGATYSEILAILGHPEAITETDLNHVRQADDAEISNNEVHNYTLTVNWDLDAFTFTSVSGWADYDFMEDRDVDFVGAPVFNAEFDESYEQFSQEFRLTSPLDERFDWIAGAFYQTSDVDLRDAPTVPTDSVLGLLSGGALLPVTNTAAARNYKTDSDLWALFAQGTWAFSDDWRLTVGARYTQEDKSATRVINVVDLVSRTITMDPAAPILYEAAFAIENEQASGHNLAGSRSESSFTPLVNLQHNVNDAVMLYGSVSTGFKAGGFDARANVTGSWEFENEDATAFEFGGKATLGGGRAELNFAIYHTDYDDLQVSQFDGTLGFTVGNAKKTRVQGFEVDGRVLLADNLTLGYGLAYLDHEFREFTSGNCYNRQVPDGDVVNGVPLCNYSGKAGQYTPEITASAELDWVRPAFGDFDFRLTADLSYSGEQNVHVNLDPVYVIDPYTIFNLRLALESDKWNLALLGRNLTDEKVLTYVGNVPLSGSTFGTNTYYGFVARPFSFALQASYAFGK